VQWCLRLPDINPHFPKGTTVFVLLAVLVLIVIASIVAVVVDVHKDGFRRVPDRKLVRIF
jgi:hypothetical protein